VYKICSQQRWKVCELDITNTSTCNKNVMLFLKQHCFNFNFFKTIFSSPILEWWASHSTKVPSVPTALSRSSSVLPVFESSRPPPDPSAQMTHVLERTLIHTLIEHFPIEIAVMKKRRLCECVFYAETDEYFGVYDNVYKLIIQIIHNCVTERRGNY
jgi:hypothetical protein